MRIGIDVGGTFTDLIMAEEDGSNTTAVKTLSTSSPADGILTALSKGEVDLSAVTTLVFGSTIAINALVENKAAPVGTISNVGFRDVLELRRIWREHLFGSFWQRPAAMVPRRLRREVACRINVAGEETQPLDTEGLLAQARFLVDNGVQSIAISFLHSHLNDVHERQARDLLAAEFPDLCVAISSEESPEIGEYERMSTTVVAAALKPLLAQELSTLEDALRRQGMRGDIHVMKSNGGVMSIAAAQRKPHELVQSGPAGGVAAARRWGAALDLPNLITLDVGGTTADVSLIRAGKATMARRMELEWDVPVRGSLVDIHSVGAGGGSIAWVDAAGRPRLGPGSAGSRPGPACLGRGGTQTTVTDAALLAGWLNGGNFAGGEIPLDASLSSEAVRSGGLSPALGAATDGEAGAAVLALAANAIAEKIRALTVKHGEDPRDYALFVYGGAGGLFGADVADSLGVGRVVLPPNSSVLSAWGGLLADEEHDYARTVLCAIGDVDFAHLDTLARGMLDQARVDFGSDEFEADFLFDLRYEGQSHELTVPGGVPVTAETLRAAADEFTRLHQHHYGHIRPEDRVEIAALRLHAHRPLLADESRLLAAPAGDGTGELRPAAARRVYRHPRQVADWPVVSRDAMRPGHTVAGPAVVEDATSTLVVPAGWGVEVGKLGEINVIKQGSTS